MIVTIRYETKDGKRHTMKLKDARSLVNHSHPNREVYILMKDLSIYTGHTKGTLDAEGCIILNNKGTIWSFEIKLDAILGWKYK